MPACPIRKLGSGLAVCSSVATAALRCLVRVSDRRSSLKPSDKTSPPTPSTRLASFFLSFFSFAPTIPQNSSPGAPLRGGRQRGEELVLARGRGPDGLDHLADELGAHLGHGLVLGEGHVGEEGRVADDAGLGVAVDVGLPLPARRVRVAGADVLGLEALELLLRAELVGLLWR